MKLIKPIFYIKRNQAYLLYEKKSGLFTIIINSELSTTLNERNINHYAEIKYIYLQ